MKPADWTSPDFGWGVLLPDNDMISPQDRARALDAPQPIRDVIEARNNAPVLRYRPELGDKKLARYFDDGSRQDPEIGLLSLGQPRKGFPSAYSSWHRPLRSHGGSNMR